MGKTIVIVNGETTNLNEALGIVSQKDGILSGENCKLGVACKEFFETKGDKNLLEIFKLAAELCENDNELAFAFFCVGASFQKRMDQQSAAANAARGILGALLQGMEEPETYEHVVTEEDIKNNPELTEEGINVGDTIHIPEGEALRDTPPAEAAPVETVAPSEPTAEYVPEPRTGPHNHEGDATAAGPGHA